MIGRSRNVEEQEKEEEEIQWLKRISQRRRRYDRGDTDKEEEQRSKWTTKNR